MLLLCSLSVNALNYRFVKTLNEVALRILPAGNGNFYTISTQLDCPDDHVLIRYFSPQGQLLNGFQSPAYIGDITSLDALVRPNGNIVLYIRMNDINHHLYEFTSAGSLVWNNNLQFTNPVIKFVKIKEANGGGLYLLGNTLQSNWSDSSRAILTRLNPVGKHIWTKYYRMNNTLPASTEFNDIVVENNRLVLCGRFYYPGTMTGWAPYRPLITLTDTAGSLQQSYYYMVDSTIIGFDDYEFVQMRKSNAGNYYFMAFNFGNEHAFFKIDAQFQLKWIREHLSGRANTICTGANDDLYYVPESPPMNFVAHFDSAGNDLPGHITKDAPGTDIEYGHIIQIEADDCGYLLTSTENMLARTDANMNYCIDSTYNYPVPYYPVTTFYRANAYLQQGVLTSLNEYLMTAGYTSASGTLTDICSSTFSCGGATGWEDVNLQKLSVFPNPAGEEIHISVPEPGFAELYDPLGRLVLKNEGSPVLQLQSIPSGIYQLKWIGKEHQYHVQLFHAR